MEWVLIGVVVAIMIVVAIRWSRSAGTVDRTFARTVSRETGEMLERLETLSSSDIPGPLQTLFTVDETRSVLASILDAATRSLWLVSNQSPPEFGLAKMVGKSDVRHWVPLVAGTILAWSVYYKNPAPDSKELFNRTWQCVFGCYRKATGYSFRAEAYEVHTKRLANSVALGTPSGMERFMVEVYISNVILGDELIQGIWGEGLGREVIASLPNKAEGFPGKGLSVKERRAAWVGAAVWTAYQQIVQPVLERAYTE